MLKFIKLMSMALVLFLTIACNKGSGGEPQSPAVSASGGGSVGTAGSPIPESLLPQHPPVGAGGGIITGTLMLDPSLTSKVTATNVVYITARSPDRPSPPIAAQQLRDVKFPYQYTLSAADLMQGGSFEGKVNIVVRVDRDGAAGPPQPGDLEGVYASNPATVGDQKVDVVINKEY